MSAPFYFHERNWGARLSEWTYRGMRCLTLENELLRVSLLIDKGTDIFEFLHKPTDTDFLWRSASGVRNPSLFVPTSARSQGAFLDFYEGGWQECFPSGGTPTTTYGGGIGQHGEVCLIPWNYTILQDHPDRVQVKLSVRTYRTPFLFEKVLTLERNSSVLTIDEVVTNEGRVEMDFVWGHHPAFGGLFLDQSCRVDLPGAEVEVLDTSAPTRARSGKGYSWSIVPGTNGAPVDLSTIPSNEAAATSDLMMLTNLQAGWYAVTNRARRVGFGMVWSLDVFNTLWYWQEFNGLTGYPLYGRTYTMALEPWTTPQMNVEEARGAGTHRTLAPGASLATQLRAVAFADVERVKRIELDGNVIAR